MKSFEQQLKDVSEGWVKDGVVTAGQREALLARHPERASGGRLAAILGAVGGGLVLAGVCLLIGANWEEIGDWTKIMGLVGLLVGSYLAGWRLAVKPGGYPLVGETFFMVGAGLFMAGIALVSQIYHLNGRPATAVMIWWLGIAGVPWVVKSKGAWFMSLLAMVTWLGMEVMTAGSWLAVYDGGRWARSVSVLAGWLTVIGLAVWLGGLGLKGTMKSLYADMTERWGAFLTCGALYLLSFVRHEWRWVERADGDMRWQAGVFLAAVLAVAGGLAWRAAKREVVMMGWWWLPVGLAVAGVLGGVDLGDGGWGWSVLAWAGLFGMNLAMIRTGLATGREGWVNLGVTFIALNIVTRYFDLFGTMMEGGIFFVVTGVMVLGVGFYLERKRRAWLGQMRGGDGRAIL